MSDQPQEPKAPSLLELQAHIKELEDGTAALPANESGFSLNWQMQDRDGASVNITMRAAAAVSWPHVMGVRANFMQKALAAGWKPAGIAPAAPLGPAPNGQNGNASPSQPYYWLVKDGVPVVNKGKMTLVIRPDGSQPNEIACPIHAGQKLRRRSNDNGAWLSHKLGDGYCSANFQDEQS